jgi:DNA-binding response OmpR family regulator
MKRLRVLLAIADGALLEAYRDSLTTDGFTVATAADALECVSRLRGCRPDVLVLDPDLPWGGGEGVMAMTYEDPDVPFVPVLALAAQPHPGGWSRVGAFPVADYQVRPLEATALAERLHRIHQRHKTGRSRRATPPRVARTAHGLLKEEKQCLS